MSGRRLWVALLCVMTFTAVLFAQEEKNEVGGDIGRIFISDQGIQNATFPDPVIHSGKGLSFEVNYARRLFITPVFSISAEVPAVFNLDEDLNGGAYLHAVVPSSYKQFFVAPSARLNLFPTTAVSPWISVGGGFAHFNEGDTLVYGGTNPGKSTTSGVLQGGLGLDVKFVSRLIIRGEARDFWSGEPSFPLAPTGKTRQHNYFVGAGVFWRF